MTEQDYWNERYTENVADGMFIITWSNMIQALHSWGYGPVTSLPGEIDDWRLPAFWGFDSNLKFAGWE